MPENEMKTPPDIRKNHKKQTLWQIWVPLIIGILIMLFLGVMAVIITTRDVSGEFNTKWASISAIYLSLPALLVAFIFLTILIGLIYLFSKLYVIIPEYLHKGLGLLYQIRDAVDRSSQTVTKPVITAKSKWQGFTTLFKKKSKRMQTTS
jgi:hypothetical protein